MENVYYINLEHRKDRKIHVEQELSKLGWKYQRFNAIKDTNGRIGCSMSHLKILENAKEKNLNYVIIVEDDIVFTNIKLFKTNFYKFLKLNINFDVLLLGGNLWGIDGYNSISYKINKCATTIGYLVKNNYYNTLISNIKKGIELLKKNPELHTEYSIDKYWAKLQQKDNWFLIRPLTVTQLDNYSDIEKKNVTYGELMLK